MADFYFKEKNGVQTLLCRPLEECGGIRHGFSTRIGGVSEGYLAGMNFSYSREAAEKVDENYRRFCCACGLPFDSLVLTHQTHTANVAVAEGSLRGQGRYRELRDTDGLVTAAAGLGLCCFTADCVPILLADPQNRVVASVHAGWRGTIGEISARAVEKMAALGASPANIFAAIGPSIGPCHFEVGPEVQAEFTARFGEALPQKPSVNEGRSMVDLWQANRLVLQGAGLAENHIFTAEICTFCNNSLFYSHRYTNGRRGNMVAAIALEE